MSADHDRHAELIRAIRIARAIAQEPKSYAEIARDLGCTPRTVRRAIYALQAAGVDIHPLTDVDGDEPSRAARKRWRLDRQAWAGMLFLPAD